MLYRKRGVPRVGDDVADGPRVYEQPLKELPGPRPRRNHHRVRRVAERRHPRARRLGRGRRIKDPRMRQHTQRAAQEAGLSPEQTLAATTVLEQGLHDTPGLAGVSAVGQTIQTFINARTWDDS